MRDLLHSHIAANVTLALLEDLQPADPAGQLQVSAAGGLIANDISAGLLSAATPVLARVITREPAVLCGQAWVIETARQVDSQISLDWQVQDGDTVSADQVLFMATGKAASLLTFERTALNFLQVLSGTATLTADYVARVAHTSVRLLDTRKTIPGLRYGQKYAVTCGGGGNHRMGLYDAFLLKENHIHACGGIAEAVTRARRLGLNVPLEIEVENLTELEQALAAGADSIMLDNFTVYDLRTAVALNREQYKGQARLEASGGITLDTLVSVAETGVDYISIGALTKDCHSIDLSMRLVASETH